MREAPTLLAAKPPQDSSSPHMFIEPGFGMLDPDGSTDIVGEERFDAAAQGAIASGQYTWPSRKGYSNITAVALSLQHCSPPLVEHFRSLRPQEQQADHPIRINDQLDREHRCARDDSRAGRGD